MSIHDYSTGEMPAPEQKQYNTQELQQEFEVVGFLAPYVQVKRKADGKVGIMQFNHSPRVYWGFDDSSVQVNAMITHAQRSGW